MTVVEFAYRNLVALAHLDGKIDASERAVLDRYRIALGLQNS